MRFIAEVKGNTHTIDVDNLGADDGYYTMTINGEKHEVDAQLLRSHIVSMLIDHRSYDVDIEPFNVEDTLDGRMSVRVRGRVVHLDILDERRKKMKEAAAAHLGGAGVSQVESPMPGKVLNVMVDEGDEVTQGQGVVVIEAMKMENELKAPKDGVVASISCKNGDTVDAGTVLIVIE